jgi:hypothetical protein
VADAQAIRRRVLGEYFCTPNSSRSSVRVADNFEMASLPSTSEKERKRLLSFVVCGGGPTGVETAAVRPHPFPIPALFAHLITRRSLICAKKILSTTWVPIFLSVQYVKIVVTNFLVSEDMSGTGFHSCHSVPGTYFEHSAPQTKTWLRFLIFLLHSTLKQYRNLRRINSNVMVWG